MFLAFTLLRSFRKCQNISEEFSSMSLTSKVLTPVFVAATLIFSLQAEANLIVIGDVDAPNTSNRSQNYDLLENVRGGGTDILWLTGGYAVNSRYTDLRSRWTTEGAAITDDLTASISSSLAGRDLVVISQLWSNSSLFDATAQSALANYLIGGGEALYIAQVASGTLQTQYNNFLSGIGSSMSFLPTGGNTSGTEVIDTNTPYGTGVSLFELGGWTAMDVAGGTAVVTLNGAVGVAYETFAQVPEPGALAILGIGLTGLGFARRKRAA
ncbi:MAG: hypothetical protein ACI9JL_004136 [Paracoccaceae bacterium]|jgi:hypothetical protein